MRFLCITNDMPMRTLTYEEVCERFPWFKAMVPDEEYAVFNEFQSVKFKISRMTIEIFKEGTR